MLYQDLNIIYLDILLLNAQQHNNVITNTNIQVSNCHKQYIYDILFK